MTEAVVAALSAVSTATLATLLSRKGVGSTFLEGVKPLNGTARVAGRAFTLRFIPAREDLDRVGTRPDPNDLMRDAIEAVPPRHVLVMDCRRETRASAGGGLLFARLEVRGVAGVVSDGCVRGTGVLNNLTLPIFCAGSSAPVSRGLHHPLEYGKPIGCGGVAIYPGDIVVGDADGVIVIPAAMADEVAREASRQEALERYLLTRLQEGAPLHGTYPPDEVTTAAFESMTEVSRHAR